MSDPQDPTPGEPGQSGEPGQPEVGSVGEEAAKLLGALGEWAKDSGGDVGAGLGATLGGLGGLAASAMSDVNEHIATGSAECTYCPVCRTVHAIRETSPEVKAHLATAASSFLQAVAGVLATLPAGPGPGGSASPAGGLEKIDLDGDEGDDE